MTYVLTQPQVMATAAEDVAGIGLAVNLAHAAAASPTTGVVAAAADEVSAATATLFNTYARQYRAVSQQAAAFHGAFTQALVAAGNTYANAEAANAVAVSGALGAGAADPNITLIMGGSGNPIPSPIDVTNVFDNYIASNPNFSGFTLSNAQALFTPEGTGINSLHLNESVAQGVTILNSTLVGTGVGQHGLIIPGGNPVVVVGYSQSSLIASLEMEKLAAMTNPPTASQLSFVLLGDPMNPNGGLWERFAGLNLPSLGVTFYGATPPDTIYPTNIYTLEYDGAADFPQYPIDFLSDLNAIAGIYYVHGSYGFINPTAPPPGYTTHQLPTSPGYTGVTNYSMITIPNLPLLDPVRAIPVIGNPIADLLQPDLTYLVNWGYGNPSQGWSTGYANVPTPFGLFPPLSATTALGGDLVTGAQHGIVAAGNALSANGAQGIASLSGLSLPAMSTAVMSNPLAALSAVPTALTSGSWIDNAILALQATNTNIASTFSNVLMTAYGVAAPTADIVTAGLITIPSYDGNLFLDGILQAANGAPVQGLINAIGYPIAANTALIPAGGFLELLVLAPAAASIVDDFMSI